MDRLIRALARLAKRTTAPVPEKTTPPWVGLVIVEPDGLELGRVSRVVSDGGDGAWVTLRPDWGALEWLGFLGGGHHPEYTFHSDDLERVDDRLRLKKVASSEAA